MFKRTTLFFTFALCMNLLGLWPKLWLRWFTSALWSVVRLRDVLRAVARRNERIPHTHGWLQTCDTQAASLL